jgi:AAT family amino acid transporter
MEVKELERYGEGYLEERKLVPRWPAPIPQIVNTLFVLAVFYVTWWIFQDPRGWLRMYTPYVGYMYTRWLLIMLIWMVYVYHYWPFKRRQLDTWHPVLKGIVMTGIATGILLILIKGFFEGLLGNFAMAYFNPAQLTKLPGITEFFAIEYAALACLMFAAIASWLSPSWPVAMEMWPWQGLRQPALGTTVLLVTFFIGTIVYLCTMHPHMGILYYPWQYFASIAPPYWENFADTVSGNFHVAWIMCCTIVVWLYESIWERYPFRLIRNNTLRRWTAFFGIVAIAWCCFLFLYFAQELWWGPAIRGTRRDAAPDWRWLHVGETMVFFLIPALFTAFYCNNWPRKFSTPVNWLIRTGIAVVGGMFVYWVYYNTSHLVLGTQKGYSHPQQFPMIPTIWLINIMLINHWFMDNWPGWKRVPVASATEQKEVES